MIGGRQCYQDCGISHRESMKAQKELPQNVHNSLLRHESTLGGYGRHQTVWVVGTGVNPNDEVSRVLKC